MEIQNEVTEKPTKEKPQHVVVRNTADYQRMKLEKLMKNPVSYPNIRTRMVIN